MVQFQAHRLLANPCALPAQCEGGCRCGLCPGTTTMTVRGRDEESFTVVALLLADLKSAPPHGPLDGPAA